MSFPLWTVSWERASLLGDWRLCLIPFSSLGSKMAWTLWALCRLPLSVTSYIPLPICKNVLVLFHHAHSPPLAFTIFLPSLLLDSLQIWWSLSISKWVFKGLLLSKCWCVVGLCISSLPLQEEVSIVMAMWETHLRI